MAKAAETEVTLPLEHAEVKDTPGEVYKSEPGKATFEVEDDVTQMPPAEAEPVALENTETPDPAPEVAETTPEAQKAPVPAVATPSAAVDPEKEALKTELAQKKQLESFITERAQKSPEFRKAYLAEVKAANGGLPPEAEAELTRLSTPQPTEAQLIAWFDKNVAEKGLGYANAMWDRHVVQPREAANRAESQAREAFREQQRMATEKAQLDARVHTELTQEMKQCATKAYPELFVRDTDAKFGYSVKDPKTRELMNGWLKRNPDSTFEDAMTMALHKQGKLSAKAPKPPIQKPASGRPISANPGTATVRGQFTPGKASFTVVDHG